MFSKNKHWKNIPYVYTMFLSWDRRSQDGFPAVGVGDGQVDTDKACYEHIEDRGYML